MLLHLRWLLSPEVFLLCQELHWVCWNLLILIHWVVQTIILYKPIQIYWLLQIHPKRYTNYRLHTIPNSQAKSDQIGPSAILISSSSAPTVTSITFPFVSTQSYTVHLVALKNFLIRFRRTWSSMNSRKFFLHPIDAHMIFAMEQQFFDPHDRRHWRKTT